MPFRLGISVIGGFTPEPVGFTGVFIAVFDVLFKGNFLSVPNVVVPAFGFYSFTYGAFNILLFAGFIYGALVVVEGFVTAGVVVGFFWTALLTVVDAVFVDVTLFFLAKSTVEGYLFSCTDDCVYLPSYVFGVYVFAPNCLLAVNGGLISVEGLLARVVLG